MSVYDELANILRKAQGQITRERVEIDIGAEVVRMRQEYDSQRKRIADLDKVAEAALKIWHIDLDPSNPLRIALIATGYLKEQGK